MSCACEHDVLLRAGRDLHALLARGQASDDQIRNRLREIDAMLANADKPAAPVDYAAELAEKRAEILNRAYRGAMAPFKDVILESTSPKDLRNRLKTIFPNWSAGRLNSELEEAMQLCAAAGAGQVKP